MSKISKGTHPLVLEECIGSEDGSKFWRYPSVVSDSPENADDLETNSLEWTCEPDTDDLEVVISIDPDLLATLVRGARAHCVACPGCTRA